MSVFHLSRVNTSHSRRVLPGIRPTGTHLNVMLRHVPVGRRTSSDVPQKSIWILSATRVTLSSLLDEPGGKATLALLRCSQCREDAHVYGLESRADLGVWAKGFPSRFPLNLVRTCGTFLFNSPLLWKLPVQLAGFWRTRVRRFGRFVPTRRCMTLSR